MLLRASDMHAYVRDMPGYIEKPVQHKVAIALRDNGATVKAYFRHSMILST